ncbi:MAG: pseudouridine synthase, partial [Phyllobacteriaceae bacterium]|nr:pseudouridine synthase [Phyllobacteriaceae bacterium]
MTETPDQKSAPQASAKGADDAERIAKVLARAGLCSRREAEEWVNAGRVAVNGTVLSSPAFTVTPSDRVTVDGVALPMKERTRLWLFHKPRGLVTTNQDPEGRPTVFSVLPEDMPRVVTVGRLDINTEGLLLLTNDGGVARVLELPSTGWLRRYRVRAFGRVEESALKELREGISLDGVDYGPIEAEIERVQGSNLWLVLGLREGKNREVKRVLASLGLTVNRLIRVSFGPFQLADLDEGEIREIRGRILRDQLGPRLVAEAGADFEAPIIHHMAGDGGEDEGKKRRIRDFAPAGETAGGGRDGRRPPRTKMEFVGTGEKRSRDRGEDRGERPRRGRDEGFGDRFAGGRSEGYRDRSRDGDFAPRPPRERRERPAGVGSSPKDRPVRGRRFEAGEGPADRGEGRRDGGFRGRPTGDGPRPPRNRFGKSRPDGDRDRRGEGSEGRPQGDRPRVFRDRSEAGAPAKAPRAEGFGPRGPRG